MPAPLRYRGCGTARSRTAPTAPSLPRPRGGHGAAHPPPPPKPGGRGSSVRELRTAPAPRAAPASLPPGGAPRSAPPGGGDGSVPARCDAVRFGPGAVRFPGGADPGAQGWTGRTAPRPPPPPRSPPGPDRGPPPPNAAGPRGGGASRGRMERSRGTQLRAAAAERSSARDPNRERRGHSENPGWIGHARPCTRAGPSHVCLCGCVCVCVCNGSVQPCTVPGVERLRAHAWHARQRSHLCNRGAVVHAQRCAHGSPAHVHTRSCTHVALHTHTHTHTRAQPSRCTALTPTPGKGETPPTLPAL